MLAVEDVGSWLGDCLEVLKSYTLGLKKNGLNDTIRLSLSATVLVPESNPSQHVREKRITIIMVSINKIEDFPILTRAGRQTEEVVMVRDALKQSIDNNYEAFELSGIPADNYNSWQQRIRTQAKKLGINVEVRFSAEKETLAFRAKAPKTTGKPEKDSK